MRVRFGVIDCGTIGQKRHIPEIAEHPDAQLVAVCGPVQPQVEEVAREYGVHAFGEYGKVLTEADGFATRLCLTRTTSGRASYSTRRQGMFAWQDSERCCGERRLTAERGASRMTGFRQAWNRSLLCGTLRIGR